MKTRFNKFNLLSVFILVSLILLMSCQKDSKGMKNPEPSENPVYLTADAQTKDVWVKYMNWIGTNDPENDIITGNTDQSKEHDIWRQIQHDWVTIKCKDDVPKEVVRITVEQNTTTEDRTYEFITLNNVHKTTLTIIQKGVSSN